MLTADQILQLPEVQECVRRSIIEIIENRIKYHLRKTFDFNWEDPEEWVRCASIAHLVILKQYPVKQVKLEVRVPRRTPNDLADIVVYEDPACAKPYLVVECKSQRRSVRQRADGIEQLFGNTNSLRAKFGLYDEYTESVFFDVAGHAQEEREDNILGQRDAVPVRFGKPPEFALVCGSASDIGPVKKVILEAAIKRAHSLIWSGGKRDPLSAFDEWSKLLFAKVEDERNTPTKKERRFQVGSNEDDGAVAERIHKLFQTAIRSDSTIFPEGIRIDLPDKKIADVVKCLQKISFKDTDVDTIGMAFESFFGSVFRGQLGQYFTMRQLSRFAVAMLDVNHEDYIIDPSCGSGGFLLEALLQAWHRIEDEFDGQRDISDKKKDFALLKVFGIEIHDILGRIAKINLLLHHDGHTNIESGKSCLDKEFTRQRLNPPRNKFTKIVGNPPFGDDVEKDDEDKLGASKLEDFKTAENRDKVPSEHIILERCVELLYPEGTLGLVLPDGVFNNQGWQSNCPQVRRYLAMHGRILAVISLPDYAFRKSGAQNKTSILFFRKFSKKEKSVFEEEYEKQLAKLGDVEMAVSATLKIHDYHTFLAEANWVGYTTTGIPSSKNDLYSEKDGRVTANQDGKILGEYRKFLKAPVAYHGRKQPDCMAAQFSELWDAHPSNRLDPKYHLFVNDAKRVHPKGWRVEKLSKVLSKRESIVSPSENPTTQVAVMTISQTGEIRHRAAGKGRNPPEWLGMYFEDSPSTWYEARKGDVVFSSIDLWKGCISVVPPAFDNALVTKEFPIYEVTDDSLAPEFLSCLLRTRFYQRAFRAITTGHSNRRRTQVADFEDLDICYPPTREQQMALVKKLLEARQKQVEGDKVYKQEMLSFSDLIDGRGDEELPEIGAEEDDESDDAS